MQSPQGPNVPPSPASPISKEQLAAGVSAAGASIAAAFSSIGSGIAGAAASVGSAVSAAACAASDDDAGSAVDKTLASPEFKRAVELNPALQRRKNESLIDWIQRVTGIELQDAEDEDQRTRRLRREEITSRVLRRSRTSRETNGAQIDQSARDSADRNMREQARDKRAAEMKHGHANPAEGTADPGDPKLKRLLGTEPMTETVLPRTGRLADVMLGQPIRR